MGDRFEVKSLKQAFELIKDEELEVVHKQFVKDFDSFKFQGIYTSLKEIREGIIERIFDGFRSKYNELKSDISQLRKRGYEVSVLDFTLLTEPLKEKLLIATFSIENYQKVLGVFSSVESEIKFLVEDMEAKEREKDALEKAKAQEARAAAGIKDEEPVVEEKIEENSNEEETGEKVKKKKSIVKGKKKVVKKVGRKKSVVSSKKKVVKKKTVKKKVVKKKTSKK